MPSVSFDFPQRAAGGWVWDFQGEAWVSSLRQSASVTSANDWVLSPHHNHSRLRVSHFWPFNQWFCSRCVSKLAAQRSRNNLGFRGDDGVSRTLPVSHLSLSFFSHALTLFTACSVFHYIYTSTLWPTCLFLHVLLGDPYGWPRLCILTDTGWVGGRRRRKEGCGNVIRKG